MYLIVVTSLIVMFSSCQSFKRDHSIMRTKKELKVIGWREWAKLPDLGVDKIKVKVDSGARTSSLHAYDISTYKRGDSEFVKFIIHPSQKSNVKTIIARAKIHEYRKIKSSNGAIEKRPVIITPISFMGEQWDIEVTLTNRDEMGFRMLLGRESIRNRFLIDTGKSFLSEKRKNSKGKK